MTIDTDKTTTTVTPQVYIADLAAYNEGELVGKHFLPGEYADHEDFSTAVSEYLASLPFPEWAGPREEHAIHDFEGFGSYRVGEYESLESVWTIASMIEKHGLAYPAFMSNDSSRSEEDFEEAFAGEWDSEKDFAMNYADDIGAVDDNASWPNTCIDWDYATRELMWDYWSERTGNGTGSVYVFRSI